MSKFFRRVVYPRRPNPVTWSQALQPLRPAYRTPSPLGRRPIPTWLTAAALVLCALAAAADPDADQAKRLVEQGAILPLEEILPRVRAAREGTLIELDLHHEQDHDAYVYEIELLDAEGRLWELELDATTGELIELELDAD